MSISIKTKRELGGRLLEVNFLNEREKDILKMRLGIEGYESSTLEEIADKYGITRERVRQIGEAIVDKIKKNMREEAVIANSLFVKTWIPKYVLREKEVKKWRAAIKRKRSIAKNKYKNLVALIQEFSTKGTGEEEINRLFKELRISYRKNKSLFDPYMISELKKWRKQYTEIKYKKPLAPKEEDTHPLPSTPPRPSSDTLNTG